MRIISDIGRFADEVQARIERARRRVDVASASCPRRSPGHALAGALSAAAARGVACRLLCDPKLRRVFGLHQATTQVFGMIDVADARSRSCAAHASALTSAPCG
jgi:hypothetical protein